MNKTAKQTFKRAVVASTAAVALLLTSGGVIASAAETQTVATATPMTFAKLAAIHPDLKPCFRGHCIPNPIDPIKDGVKDGYNGVKDGFNFLKDHPRDIARCLRAGEDPAKIGGQVGRTVGPGGQAVGTVVGLGAGCARELR